MKIWVLEMTEWSACLALPVLNPGSSGCNPLDKLILILLTGNSGWFEIYEDDSIRAKKMYSLFFYSLTSPFTEFLRILNLVIQTEALVADKLRGATEIT